MSPKLAIFAIIIIIIALAGIGLVALGQRRPPPATVVGDGRSREPSTYTGREVCAECHAAETEAWAGTHHDLAMQPATEDTVLGDFEGAVLDHYGQRTTFTRRDGRFMVRTLDGDGQERDFEVAYTYGVDPLQQYLIPFPDGRVQALSVCWDTRPAEQGGQRWFHLYPAEPIPPNDPLHWTRPAQNWNHSCAECHSTGVHKGFDAPTGTYATTWSEIDVSCESCHGPGSRHVAWARSAPEPQGDPQLEVDLADRDGGTWEIAAGDRIAKRSKPRDAHIESERCARCHSRRSQLYEDIGDTTALADSHRLALLDAGLYFSDGQIEDEVFVHGSWLQSKMYTAGVTCRDCHDPHSLKVYLPGNLLCARCHLQSAYDTPEHHHHEVGTKGAECVECHMPTRTYMVVDARRDHSMRVPRPDLSQELGTPNVCTGCHQDQTDAWAAESIAGWLGPAAPPPAPHFATTIAAGRRGLPGATRALAALAARDSEPAIVRGTAVSLLRAGDSPAAQAAVRAAAGDPSPLVRRGALTALLDAPPEVQESVAAPLLRDPSRAVRQEASRMLLRNLAEWHETQELHADRAESNVNVGSLLVEQGDLTGAERAYLTALVRDPLFTPASVNLADLYRIRGDEPAAERTLRAALEREPASPPLHHSLGLLLVRTGRNDEALRSLGRAAELDPGQSRFAYVHGVALVGLGQRPAGLAVLHTALARHPGDRDLLVALIGYALEDGNLDEARTLNDRLLEVLPDDPQARELDRRLRGGR